MILIIIYDRYENINLKKDDPILDMIKYHLGLFIYILIYKF